MQNDLERLHKILGRVCGDIVIALTIYRLTGGKATLRGWLAALKEAEEIIERLAK